jgi:hypothetical protein
MILYVYQILLIYKSILITLILIFYKDYSIIE